MKNDHIVIKGARVNNLKNIDLTLPRNQFIIMTGLSGSGKTSLAFDTIYAEGQRRYVESLSAYARQFLGNMEKPDVDSIEGLSPAIAIDQKTTSNNPRSTVGTVTEIYDYLRLLYARVGTPMCPIHHHPIVGMSIKAMVEQVMAHPTGSKIELLAPVVRNQKGSHKDLMNDLLKQGFVRVRVNGEMKLLEDDIQLNKNNKHTLEVMVDRLILSEQATSRLYDSIETSLKLSSGLVLVLIEGLETLMSSNYACAECGFSLPHLEPRLFSFNSPLGACDTCKGLGVIQQVDIDLLIPDPKLSILKGGIRYYKNIVDSENIEWQNFKTLCDHYKIPLDVPIASLSDEQKDILLHGSKGQIKYAIHSRSGNTYLRNEKIEGVLTLIQRRFFETTSNMAKDWYGTFMSESTCPTCSGKRLNEMALCVELNKHSIYDFTRFSIQNGLSFIRNLKLSNHDQEIARLVLKEVSERLQFLDNVGLSYLTLDRVAGSLSGGEAQRIRLATQIGSRLSGVLYVLDEPSIGLHQRDNAKLIQTLMDMRDLGNTLIVVEHDEETMEASDWIVDVGPGAGTHGGEIIFNGPTQDIKNCEASITGQYLNHKLFIPIPEQIRPGNGLFLKVIDAHENNLQHISVDIPLNQFVVVTGVSGSGKSSLVNEVIVKSLQHHLSRAKVKPGAVKAIEGLEHIDKIIAVDQDPIGRTPRSNPVTYTGIFDDIRDLFAMTPEAKKRGYLKGRFSFNVKGGRCESCQGDGVKRISMLFLPDVYVSCEDCEGKRYNPETLQVTYKGKTIFDVLSMSVDEGVDFFENIFKISSKLKILQDVGLGYIKLGQSATTLSGGEAQRVKLASELQRKVTGKTLFVLDEPTTGLHTHDVAKLLTVLHRIVDQGDSVLVIEHNLDIIKNADTIIDLGPEGGDGGGTIMAVGTPQEIANHPLSYTGHYLKKVHQ
ncbi:MAG: excinuclease ABC subunit UvrA [Erysipelothrix sp.]|jgi:excinuclease ABC subunit A|nr:excinuclease ABC subunit UvrA [Erysipelothrix sp.]